MSAPKDPRERARRNVRPSAATLEGNFVDLTDGPPPIGPPPTGQKWHRQVRMWWDSVWVNPFASQYLESDLGELRLLALLMQQMWTKPRVSLLVEIRLIAKGFGLNVMDRRRLDWVAEEGGEEDPETEAEPEPEPEAPAEHLDFDPRAALRAM